MVFDCPFRQGGGFSPVTWQKFSVQMAGSLRYMQSGESGKRKKTVHQPEEMYAETICRHSRLCRFSVRRSRTPGRDTQSAIKQDIAGLRSCNVLFLRMRAVLF